MDTPILDDSPLARGARLRKVRRMAGLSTEQLAANIGYSRQTISYWENAAHSGLSHKGAIKIIAAIKEFSVKCDISWLLYGIGQTANWDQAAPSAASKWQIADGDKPQIIVSPPCSVQQEIALFKQLHPTAVITQLTHDSMQPIYTARDWLGGYWEPIHTGLFSKPCLIELAGSIEVALLAPSNHTGLFNLRFLHDPTKKPPPPTLENIALKKAAKIIRVWKEE